MKSPAQADSSRAPVVLTRRTALCILLAVLSLYNPFLTVLNISDVLHVRHPLSYRATVANSELERCTIDPVTPLIPAIEVLNAWEQTHCSALSVYSIFPTRQHDDFTVAVEQVVLESIWFRPPPAV